MDPQTERFSKELIKWLLQEKRNIPVNEIANYLHIPVKRVLTIVDSYPNNFERYNDGHLTYVRPVCKLTLCALHCTKDGECNGRIPYCTGLHICKFYLLSGSCQYKQQCCYGHDLTSPHNINLRRQHNLHEVNATDLKYLFQISENRTKLTIPKICKFYNVQAGCRYDEVNRSSCPHLHLCRHYILGKCTFGRRCKRSHDMLNSHTQNILQKHGINTNRPPKEILEELRAAQPDVAGSCDGSSVSSGPVSRWSSQPVLYQMNQLTLRDDSDLSSDSGSSSQSRSQNKRRRRRRKRNAPAQNDCGCSGSLPTPAARQAGFPLPVPRQGEYAGVRPKTSALGNRVQRGDSLDRSRSSSTADLKRAMSMERLNSERICLYYLRKRCSFGQSCQNHHCDLPYQWQYRMMHDDVWQNCDLKSQKEIELSYSDPTVSEHFLKIETLVRVQFDQCPMVGIDSDGQKYDVRRLSTPSSCEVEQQPLATVWIWYWKTQKDKWEEYGNKNLTGYKASISSEDLELAYLSKPEGSLSFATQGHQYVLNFNKMVQRNLEYTTERAVRRRPVFVSKDEFQKRIANFNNKVAPAKGLSEAGLHVHIDPPQLWDIPRGMELIDHYLINKITKNYPGTRKEYKDIEKLFCESMPSTVSIKSIERIENGELWMNYVSKKARMRKKNNNKDVEERQLFHGTKVKYVDAICKQGFDFRLNGQTCGTLYGKGSYFALESRYSDSYTNQSDRMMFIVKVLVGDFTPGTKQLVRPPSKDPRNPCSDLYDSCVDKANNPTIFVIFDNNGQVYPEYLVKYEMKFS